MIGIVLVGFILAVAVVGALIGRNTSYEGFWLNDRRASVFALVSTIVATQVGAGTTLGIAASTASSGTGYGVVGLLTTLMGLLIIPFLAPAVLRQSQQSGEFTLTGLFGWRFGPVTRMLSALIVLVGYFGLLAGQVVAGALLLQSALPLSWFWAVVVSSGFVVAYAAFAGLKGDLITDKILFLFMIFLAGLTVFAISRVTAQDPEIFSSVQPQTWSPVEFGGYTYLVGGLLLGALIPLVSLEMWLRVFAGDESRKVASALRWSAIIVMPFYILPMIVGLLATVIDVPEGQQVYVDFLRLNLSPLLMVVVQIGLLATVISTTNTLQIVLGAVVHRDVLPVRFRTVGGSRLTTALVGAIGAVLAFWVRDIVDLVLTGFFYIVLIGPLLLLLVVRPRRAIPTRKQDVIAAGALLTGLIVTTVGLPSLGVAAVILGFAAVAIVIGILAFVERGRA